jgi:putative SOS response-associated peptidase YedK
MPVILPPESYDRWLGGEPDPAELIRPHPADEMITWPVSVRVNTPKNDDPAILDPVEDALARRPSPAVGTGS